MITMCMEIGADISASISDIAGFYCALNTCDRFYNLYVHRVSVQAVYKKRFSS